MAKPDPSSLVEAAAAFDRELAIYARLGELFIKTPLTSLKHLERANQTLGELADSEQRLQLSGKQLIDALSAARKKQEQLSQDVVTYAPTVQARNVQLKELMLAMGELAIAAAGINTMVMPKNGAPATDAPADTGAISAAVLALSERAHALAGTAHQAEFEELAAQAHALHQRLDVIGKKLSKAAGN